MISVDPSRDNEVSTQGVERIFLIVRALHILAYSAFLAVLVLNAKDRLSEKGLNLSDAEQNYYLLCIIGLNYFFEVLFELASSAIADRFGRGRAVQIYSLCYVVAALFFGMGSTVPTQNATQLVVFYGLGQCARALGSAFMSGTADSWATDALHRRKVTDLSGMFVNGSWVVSFSWLLGGMVALLLRSWRTAPKDSSYVYWTALPWLLIVGLMGAMFYIATRRMIPIEREQTSGSTPAPPKTFSGLFDDIKASFRTIQNDRQLMVLVWPFAAAYSLWIVIADIWQYVLSDVATRAHYDQGAIKAYLPYAWLAFCLARLVGSAFATYYVKGRVPNAVFLVAASWANSLPIVVATLTILFNPSLLNPVWIWVFLCCMMLSKIGEETLKPIRTTLLNEAIEDGRHRATINSVGTFLGAVGATVAGVVMLAFSQAQPFLTILAVFGSCAFVASFVYLRIDSRQAAREARVNTGVYLVSAAASIVGVVAVLIGLYKFEEGVGDGKGITFTFFENSFHLSSSPVEYGRLPFALFLLVTVAVTFLLALKVGENYIFGRRAPLLASEGESQATTFRDDVSETAARVTTEIQGLDSATAALVKEHVHQATEDLRNTHTKQKLLIWAWKPYLAPICLLTCFSYLLVEEIRFVNRPDPAYFMLGYIAAFLALVIPSILISRLSKDSGSSDPSKEEDVAEDAGPTRSLLWISGATVLLIVLYTAKSLPLWQIDTYGPSVRHGLRAALLTQTVVLFYFLALIGRQRKLDEDRPERKVIFELAMILRTLDTRPECWNDIDFRRGVCRRLETVAVTFENQMPSRLRTGDVVTQAWVNESSEKIAQRFRNLKWWVVHPIEGNLPEIKREVSARLVAAVKADWPRMAQGAEGPEASPLSRRERTSGVATKTLVLFLPAIPFALYIAAAPLFYGADWRTETKSMVVAGLVATAIWMTISVLFMIDKTFSQKLDAFKELYKMFKA